MPPVDFDLYLITDRTRVFGGDLLPAVERALAGGVRAVQLREKDLPAGELFALAEKMRSLTRRFDARLLINDRLDVALAVDADGVHLGGGALPAAAARRLLGPQRLIGVSTHALSEVHAADQAGADFVTFGPVYPTPSKAAYGPPLGLAALRQACRNAPLPVFPLGGITAERVPALRDAGCPRAACIGAILFAADPAAAAVRFRSALHPQG
ncbi:MAG: thiamine phosphate synthase [Desulfuromonadales bacterium]